MAGENEVEVGIGVVGGELEAQLKRVFDLMTQGAQRAEMIRGSLESWGAATRVLPGKIAEITGQLEALEGKRATRANAKKKSALEEQLEAETKQLEKANSLLRENVELQKISSIATGAAKRDAGNRTLADGRSVNEARAAESALRDAITGINTTAEQLTARLAVATGKAMERLLTSTTTAMEQSLRLAQNRMDQQSARLAVPGALNARVINAAVSEERSVALAGRGATLAEREAGTRMFNAAVDENRQRNLAENRLRRDAERENVAFDRRVALDDRNLRADAAFEDQQRSAKMARMQSQAEWENRKLDREVKAADAKMRSDADFENRQRTLAENRIRRDAERENKERDTAYKAGQSGMYGDASYEDQQRSRARARLQTQAEWENRQFDRQVNMAERSMRAAADDENRQRTLTANRVRREAERENKERDADYKAGVSRERIQAEWENREFTRIRNRQRREAEAENREFDKKNSPAGGGSGSGPVSDTDLFTRQARLATNYAIFGAITGVITGATGAVKEFDDTLFRFQAITNTAGSEMGEFRKALMGVAVDSRFSVNELAQVAIMLGQTGLSAADVGKALKPVSDLAAASGSTLQESVEAITSVLGAYGMSATRSAEVSDILVGALNRTKLTMGQLQLGIQYAANIARDSGVSFSELTATIGAVAQAGVKSGSTIGTGVRQLLTEFSSPTEKLKNVLKELGINLTDVDLRANGLSGVLKNLQNAGFTTADALRSLDLRAAAAFSAIGGQGDLIEKLRQEMLLSSAAAEGAGKANESLAATMQRLQNVAFSVVDQAFSPLTSALKTGTDALAGMVGGFEKLGPLLPAIGVGLTGIVATLALLKVGGLALGLLTSGIAGPAAIGIGAAAGVAYLLTTLVDIESAMGRVTKRLDQLKGLENELAGNRDKVILSTTDIDRQIEGLIARRDQLNKDPLQLQNAIIEAQKGFGELGFSMEGTSKSADGLIEAYQRLRGELANKLPEIGAQQIETLTQKLEALREQQRLQAESTRNTITFSDGLTTVTGDANDRYRKLGPAFQRGMDVVSDPTQLGEKDALGASAPILREMVDAAQALRKERDEERLKPAAEQNRGTLTSLGERIARAGEAIELYRRAVGEAVNIQGTLVQLDRAKQQEGIDRLKASPELQGFDRSATSLGIERTADQTEVLKAKGLDGRTRVAQLMATLSVTSEKAKDQLANLEDYRLSMVDAGMSITQVDAAIADVKGKLDQIAKNASKESRELLESVKPEATLEGQRERRANDAAITTLTKEAQATRDTDELARITAEIEAKTRANALISRELLTMGKTPEEMLSNLSLQGQLDSLDKETEERLAKLALDAAQRRKAIEDRVLQLSSETDRRREADLRARAEVLEKTAKDVRTTPEKAKELVAEINKLLDEAREIAARRNGTDMQRELRDAPTSTRDQVIEGARSGGAEGRLGYLLGLGQLESKLKDSATSETGAKGVFQFTDKTWNAYGNGANVRDTQAQITAVLKFTEDNAKMFRDRMGREPTDNELFVMHNQGGPGGTRLLKNPNTRAADLTTEENIRVNLPENMRGRAGTITAGEFTKILGGYLEEGKRTAGGSTTTSAQMIREKFAAEGNKVAAVDEKKRAEVGAIVGAKEDQATLASMRLLDKGDASKISEIVDGFSRIASMGTLQGASSSVTQAYGRLNARALKEDDLDSKNASRTDEQKAEGQAAITERFRNLATKEGITAATAAGKLATKEMDEELKRLEARKAALDTDTNRNKLGGQAEIDGISQQIEKLKEKRGLQGESQAIQAQIEVLQKAIADAEAAGLGPASKQVELNRQLVDLKEKQAKIQPQLQLQSQLATSGPNMDAALSGGVLDFEKSRGIRNNLGVLVDETDQARKQLSGALGTIGNSFDSLWVNIASGTMKSGDILKTFVTSTVTGLMSQLSKSLTNDIFSSLFGSSSGGGGFSLFGDLFKSFAGPGMANGGPIRMASGGAVNRDSKLIMAMPGEYMLRKSAVDAIGRETLDQVNALGGAMVNRAPKVDPGKVSSSARAESNVYVVGQEQVPPPGPNDIVHYVADSINRGGPIRQLIKSVAAGR